MSVKNEEDGINCGDPCDLEVTIGSVVMFIVLAVIIASCVPTPSM